jgi:hypothetical protein
MVRRVPLPAARFRMFGQGLATQLWVSRNVGQSRPPLYVQPFGRGGKLRMFHPVDVDGRSLVVLRRWKRLLGSQFTVVASGRLEHDGETLTLVGNDDRRAVSDQELRDFMVVNPDTQIAECRGFDLFLIQE